MALVYHYENFPLFGALHLYIDFQRKKRALSLDLQK